MKQCSYLVMWTLGSVKVKLISGCFVILGQWQQNVAYVK
jgi:hypothetical protein